MIIKLADCVELNLIESMEQRLRGVRHGLTQSKQNARMKAKRRRGPAARRTLREPCAERSLNVNDSPGPARPPALGPFVLYPPPARVSWRPVSHKLGTLLAPFTVELTSDSTQTAASRGCKSFPAKEIV